MTWLICHLAPLSNWSYKCSVGHKVPKDISNIVHVFTGCNIKLGCGWKGTKYGQMLALDIHVTVYDLAIS